MSRRTDRVRVGPSGGRLTPKAARSERLRGDAPRLVPAEQRVTVDLVDPAGHRLVRFGCNLPEVGDSEAWWDASTLGRNVEFQQEPDEAGEWRVLWFGCKACRDAGRPYVSSIDYGVVLVLLRQMRAAAEGRPRHARLTTTVSAP
ncbi:MAG: hypothetical protein KDB60_07540 [Propionibacteriaceae bacterium]|nr:hypothetical protein [Propionibacteriaceae bacterium]